MRNKLRFHSASKKPVVVYTCSVLGRKIIDKKSPCNEPTVFSQSRLRWDDTFLVLILKMKNLCWLILELNDNKKFDATINLNKQRLASHYNWFWFLFKEFCRLTLYPVESWLERHCNWFWFQFKEFCWLTLYPVESWRNSLRGWWSWPLHWRSDEPELGSQSVGSDGTEKGKIIRCWHEICKQKKVKTKL